METLYIKNEKGRYIPVSNGFVDELTDGVWLIQSSDGKRSKTSMKWKIGDVKDPLDLINHASLQTLCDDIALYLMRLSDMNSEEFKDAERILGGYLKGEVSFMNISPNDLASLILRQIGFKLDENIDE